MKIRQLRKEHRCSAQFIFWGKDSPAKGGITRSNGGGWDFGKEDNKESFKLEIIF